MMILAVLRRRAFRAWVFIGLLLSQHLHAVRVKILDNERSRRTASAEDDLSDILDIDADSTDEDLLRDALSGLTQEQAQQLVEGEIYDETDLSSIFRVDIDPGSAFSMVTSQSRHYTEIRYAFVFAPRVLLKLYRADSDGTRPYRIMELFSDSEIVMKDGKHGLSVLVSGTELTDSNHTVSGGPRSTWKFRVEKKHGEPLSHPEHLQQLVTDLQTATIYATPAGPQMTEPRLGTCTLRSDGSCWPQNFCARETTWKKEQSQKAVCLPVQGDANMALAWKAMMNDLTALSEHLLAKHCLTKCQDDWFHLLSHLQAARSVLDGIDAFDADLYGETRSAIDEGEEVIEEIETNMKRSIDQLPSKYTQKDKCKLPSNLENLGKSGEEDVTLAFQDYAKDCPELASQVDEAIQSIDAVERVNSDVSASVSGNSTALVHSSSSLIQYSQNSQMDPVTAAAVICGLWYLAVITGAVAATIVTALITYMILKLIVAMLCATISMLKGEETRNEFRSKCNSIGRKAAFGISVVVGLGVGIFFGGPFVFALLAGQSFTLAVPTLTAAGLAPVTQAFWLGAGAVNPGALYGIIAAYGVSAISWGGIAVLTHKIRNWRKNRRKDQAKKKKEEARMAEWLEQNGAQYPWKKTRSDKGKDFYVNVENRDDRRWPDKLPSEGVEPLPAPWEAIWDESRDRYRFWNPRTKEKSLDRLAILESHTKK